MGLVAGRAGFHGLWFKCNGITVAWPQIARCSAELSPGFA